MKQVFVKPGAVSTYKDGGTTAYQGWDGKRYYVDHRISSTTKGEVFDRYPKDKDANMLDVKLVFCSEPPDPEPQRPPRKALRISKSYQKLMPSNCPIIEQTADGVEVGTCTFYMPDGKTCPRHGDVSKLQREELLERMQNYLEVGGLFNPEMMEHDKVSRLIMDCREYLIRNA